MSPTPQETLEGFRIGANGHPYSGFLEYDVEMGGVGEGGEDLAGDSKGRETAVMLFGNLRNCSIIFGQDLTTRFHDRPV